MEYGFFSSSDFTRKQPISILPDCGACGLYKTCKSPKMAVTGKGKRSVLIVGEAPGKNEDQQGKQFVGESGQKLSSTLSSIGVDMRRDCWITNAIICRPPNNTTPTMRQLDYCKPNLLRTIQELKPNVIIPLGGPAIESLLSQLWKEKIGQVTKWVGWDIPCHTPNAWVVPNYHPSFVIRDKTDVASKFFRRYLKTAFEHSNKPWKRVPDFSRRVKIIRDPRTAARDIRTMMTFNRPVAFDYETDRLKPDSKDSQIVYCAVSDGMSSISYPFVGEAREATKQLLESEIPKIAHNLKFEDRWTRATLGKVKNWIWCSMIGAHIQDHRSGITSLKFQSFVQFGMPSYDDDIKPYLKGPSSNEQNRVAELDINKVLLYNGLDALLTHWLAYRQISKMGFLDDKSAFARIKPNYDLEPIHDGSVCSPRHKTRDR